MRDPETGEWYPSPTLFDVEYNTINTWWMAYPDPGNFGDILTPWLIKKITGYDGQYIVNAPFQVEVILGAGSILEFANEHTKVWGSGMITASTPVSKEATYCAVRGPLTYELLTSKGIKCPQIFGDPGLLLPRFYNNNLRKSFKLGIMPHYIDYDEVNSWYKDTPDVLVINPLNADITKVIDYILQCDKIVSSSLHGLITANAYGVPVSWVKFSNKLYGDDSKFHDYFASVKTKQSFTEIFEKVKVDQLEKLPFYNIQKFDDLPLLNAFPEFKIT